MLPHYCIMRSDMRNRQELLLKLLKYPLAKALRFLFVNLSFLSGVTVVSLGTHIYLPQKPDMHRGID